MDAEGSVGVEVEDAGEAYHAAPAGGLHGGIRALLLDPAPEDAAAVGVELGLGSVKCPEVQLPCFQWFEGHGGFVEVAGLPDDFAEGGVDEEVLAVEGEEVWALPHLSVVAGIGGFVAIPVAGGEGVEVGPVLEVFGGVEEDAAADVLDSGAYGHVVEVSLAPGGGIAEAGNCHVIRG